MTALVINERDNNISMNNSRVPVAQRRHLERWLIEWDIRTHMGCADATQHPQTPSTSQPDEASFAFSISAYTSGTVSIRDIVLLDPSITPLATRPMYFAVLANWGGDRWLVAPYGAYSVPATTGELLTERQELSLRVLCLWNARDIDSASLQKRWAVGSMSHKQREEAWAVFRNVAIGEPLPPELVDRIGAPILREDDPRREYQRAEAYYLSQLSTKIGVKDPASDHERVIRDVEPTSDWTLRLTIFSSTDFVHNNPFSDSSAVEPDEHELLAARSVQLKPGRSLNQTPLQHLQLIIAPASMLRSGTPISTEQFRAEGRIMYLHSVVPYSLSKSQVSEDSPVVWRFDTPLPSSVIPGAQFILIEKDHGTTLSVGRLSSNGLEFILTKVHTERFINNKPINLLQLVALVEARS